MTLPAMGTPLLVGIDVGTQSIRALLADMRGRTIACAARRTPTLHHGHGCAGYDGGHKNGDCYNAFVPEAPAPCVSVLGLTPMLADSI